MAIIFALISISTAMLFMFSDKIIEYYLPEGALAQLSDEVNEIIIIADHTR